MSSSTQLDPLPLPWFVFFAIVEPVTTIAGAYFAVFTPDDFYHDLIPQAFKSQSVGGAIKSAIADVAGRGVVPEEARMAVSQLGSCYFLLAMLSGLVLPTVRSMLCDPKKATPHTIQAAEKIVRNMLLALAIADWIHILLTLQLLPPQPASSPLDATALPSKLLYLARHPYAWNQVLVGNILATVVLFAARSMWMLGVGRGGGISMGKENKKA